MYGMGSWVLCPEFKFSITTSYLHIIAESIKYIENHILKVAAEILVLLRAELKEINNQVCKNLEHYDFYM